MKGMLIIFGITVCTAIGQADAPSVQTMTLDTCVELSPSPAQDEITYQFDGNCNVEAHYTYNYKSKSDVLIVTTDINGATIDKTPTTISSIDSQNFEGEAVTNISAPNCSNNSFVDGSLGTNAALVGYMADAKQLLMNSFNAFLDQEKPLACAQ